MASLAVSSIDQQARAAFAPFAGPQARQLIQTVRNAYQDALEERGALCDSVRLIPGQSGTRFRLFLNNLMNELADPRYLEIGGDNGVNFCAALWYNRMAAVVIDDWAQRKETREALEWNVENLRSETADIWIVDEDFRTIDYSQIGPFNVMFYNRAKTEQDQYDGVSLPLAAMDDDYILIVDDWNDDVVRRATHMALRDAGARIVDATEVRTAFNGEQPKWRGAQSEWNKGAMIAVVSRH